MKERVKNLFSKLVDDTYRDYFQMLTIPTILGLVAVFMSIMNIITQKWPLFISTAVFAFVSLGIALTVYIQKKVTIVPRYLFAIATLILFTFFLITGGTAGFSPIWICILPTCGILLWGAKKGSIINGAMLIIIILLLRTPLYESIVRYEYTPEFRMRFPAVFVAFYLVGILFEAIRVSTQNQLKEQKKKTEDLSHIDILTGIYNRCYYTELIASKQKEVEKRPGSIVMIDIDDFKKINDKFGHLFGDKVLVGIASIINEVVGDSGIACRWGGEEFVCTMEVNSLEESVEICENIRTKIETTYFELDNKEKVKVTVSVGAVFLKNLDFLNYADLLNKADSEMYRAKGNGKNRSFIIELQ